MATLAAMLALVLGLALLAVDTAEAQPDLFRRIYTGLDGNQDLNTCTRLLSVDKVIGCSSPEDGGVGALFHISSDQELDNFDRADHHSYITVISQDMFAKPTTLQRLGDYNKFKGALVYSPENTTASPWSPDDTSPNADFGLESANPPAWNSAGGGFGASGAEGSHWQNYKSRPIFYLTPADRDLVISRMTENNQLSTINPGYPLVAAELRSFMWGAKDAKTCLRRKHCDPLRSHNIWGTMQEYNTSQEVVMVTAQMDSLAFFHDQAIGANADASGLVALIAAARLLGDPMNSAIRTAQKNIMFVLFNGESFGYIGSSRMAYQMTRIPSNFPSAALPLTFDQIPYLLEIGQLLSGGEDITAYSYRNSARVQEVTGFLQTAAANLTSNMNVDYQAGADIPPASLRMILHEFRNETKREEFGGVFITDHPASGFTNSFYHSRLDNADYIDASSNATVEKLCNVSSVLAKSLWSMAFETEPPMPLQQADCDFVRELLYCITVDQTCQLVKDSVNVIENTPSPISRYVGVKPTAGTLTRPVGFFFNQLAAAIAVDRNVTYNSTDGCTANGRAPDYQRIRWRGTDVCYLSATFTHLAWSPAFDGYYSLKPLGTPSFDYRDGRDPRWSTWTESTWDPIKGRLFFVDAPHAELGTVLGGLAWFFLSLGIVYYLSTHITYDSHSLLDPDGN
ncbi:hypothetical protein PTSG_04283 [Salpingoeca rosetta]|uniref:Nicastrin n=1 Tax=Salpingoeca rosetta (strain ATCC 50818 / BSB-021) TaxID=946362 RepID=F2U745_SALR5|nr:uncharacterized protein PTSG_04283 [Salpingoeca rosetta]EGD83677.1 hypothetical protein PTSG_04283 [Salpingoeca rosetta]|eukprot:XP_004995181.1 hypothetical protein PTSG_04283 [Salpingoeca rosetta]